MIISANREKSRRDKIYRVLADAPPFILNKIVGIKYAGDVLYIYWREPPTEPETMAVEIAWACLGHQEFGMCQHMIETPSK